MKAFSIVCTVLLFAAVFKLPIGYFTFLRIVITLGALLIVFNEYKNQATFWVILFGLVAILFNPVIPIYLYKKSLWFPIDIVVGVLFLVKAFIPGKQLLKKIKIQ